MRTLMIGPFAWAPKGTVSARAFLIAQALARRGHEVTLLMPPHDNPAHAGYEWDCDGVHLVNMTMPTWEDSAWARLVVPLSMARRSSALKCDVVHVFKPIGYSGLAGAYIKLFWPSLPLVLDCDDWEGRGGWADIKAYPRLWRWLLVWQESWLTRRADVVTVASRALQTRAWGLGVHPDRVIYLPNGPHPLFRGNDDVSAAEQSDLRRALGVGDVPLGVYVGHITYGSEVNLILEALPHILKVIPDFRVVIIGSGEGLRALQTQTQRMQLAEKVIFTGWVDQRSMRVYLATADLALYPFRDTLVNRSKSPSKITAYMAMGKPIVASAVGEVVDYLDGGRAGLLVAPDGPSAFARGVISLLRDPALAGELGRRAIKRVWQNYNWARQVTRVEAAYGRAIDSAL